MQHTVSLTPSTHKLLTQIQDIFIQNDDDSQDIDLETVIAILASGFLEGIQEDDNLTSE